MHSAPKQFRAPTKGYEDKVFSYGKVKDAAPFIKTRDALVEYVCTMSWEGSAGSAQAMEDGKAPFF